MRPSARPLERDTGSIPLGYRFQPASLTAAS